MTRKISNGVCINKTLKNKSQKKTQPKLFNVMRALQPVYEHEKWVNKKRDMRIYATKVRFLKNS